MEPKVWKCVWCNHIKDVDPFSVCNAPDGDGHLYKPQRLNYKFVQHDKTGIIRTKEISKAMR